MRVVYADHASRLSGAQWSLLDLLDGLPADVEPVLASATDRLAAEARRLGIRHCPLPATTASLRLHPRHTVRGLAALFTTARRLRRLTAEVEADIVHANTVQVALAAGVARRLGGPPLVSHVRDVLPPGQASAAVRRWIGASADVVVANSAYTARAFGLDPLPRVITPTVDTARFDPAKVSGEAIRLEFGVPTDAPVLAVLAQITPWKAQSDAIKLLAGVRERFPAARLLVVGDVKFQFEATRFDNAAYFQRLREIVADRGLSEAVHFTGDREDVPEILAATDILLVPSWEEPFGRSIIEAGAMGVPVAATSVGGPAEIVKEGVTGLLLPPRAYPRWMEPVSDLLADPERRRSMGVAARERVLRDFSREAQTAALLGVYRSVL